MEPKDRPARPPIFLIAAFCLLWSSAFAAAKIGLADCPPLLFLGLRFLTAGLLLCAAAIALGRFRGIDRRVLGLLVLLGGLNNALYLGLSYTGMTQVSSGLTSIVISSNPVLTAGAAAVLLGETLTGRKTLGLLLGMAGVAMIVRGRLAAGADDAVGIALIFGALVSLVGGTLLFKRLALEIDLLASVGVQALASGLILLPVALALEDPGSLDPSPSWWLSFLYLVFGASIGGYLSWFALLQRTSASQASAYHFLLPPLGLLFGWLVLGEMTRLSDFLGIVPITAGIWLTTRVSGGEKRLRGGKDPDLGVDSNPEHEIFKRLLHRQPSGRANM